MSLTVLIPARKGSKRLKNKNLRNLGGRPLIEHTIEYAVKLVGPENVYVYTDIDATLFLNYGANVVERSSDAEDTSSADEYILNFVANCVEDTTQNILLLQVTSPFREPTLLENLIEIKKTTGAELVATGTSFGHDLWYDSKPFATNCFNEPRRQQDRSKKIYENGLAYLIDLSAFKRAKSLMKLSWSFFETEPLFSLDINTAIDFQIAEILYKEWQK